MASAIACEGLVCFYFFELRHEPMGGHSMVDRGALSSQSNETIPSVQLLLELPDRFPQNIRGGNGYNDDITPMYGKIDQAESGRVAAHHTTNKSYTCPKDWSNN